MEQCCSNEQRFLIDLLGIKIKRYNIKYDKFNNVDNRMDCSTRTLSKILCLSYNDVLNMQLKYGLEFQMLHSNYICITKAILYNFNYKRVEIVKNTSVAEFMYKHKTGKYVLITSKHMIAYIDGVWYDNDYCLKCPDKFLVETLKYVYTDKY